MNARLLIAASVVPLLAACSVISTPSHGAEVIDGPHIGRFDRITYVNPLPGDPLWDKLGSCLNDLGGKRGITVKTVGPPGGDVNAQVMQDQVSQAIATGAQGIVTWTGQAPSAFDALFAQARAKGILTATVLSPATTTNQNLEVGMSFADQGRLDADAAGARSGPQKLAVIVQEISGSGYDDYVNALKKQLRKYRNVELVALVGNHGMFSSDTALTAQLLAKYPQINLINNYSGFPGVPSALQEGNLAGKVALYQSADFPAQALALMQQGVLTEVRAVNPCAWAQAILANFAQAWAGRPAPAVSNQPFIFVNLTRFKQLVAKGWV